MPHAQPVPLSKLKDGFLDGTSSTYLEELEERFRTDPSSVDKTWASFFNNLGVLLLPHFPADDLETGAPRCFVRNATARKCLARPFSLQKLNAFDAKMKVKAESAREVWGLQQPGRAVCLSEHEGYGVMPHALRRDRVRKRDQHCI